VDIAQLGFEVDTKQLEKAVGLLERLERGGSGNGIVKIQQDIEKMNRSIQSAMGFVRGFIGALASIQTVRGLANMADTWSDLTSRVQLAIGPHQSAAVVMNRLSVIARQTYSSLELTAETFTRNATTLNALNKSTQQQLDYAQALNNALVVSGAKGQQAELVQNALARSMAEGAAKGDDLNLVLNYGSRVAELLAKELGTNVTGLRAMAREGKITGDVIFNSLVKNMEKVTEEAESMPATIGDAFTLLRNSILKSVGVFDQQNKLSEEFAGKLIYIADHMDEVIRAAVTLAKVLATIYAAKLLTSAAAFTAEIVRQNIAARAAASAARDMGIANDGAFKQSIKSVGKLGAALNIVGAAVAGWQIGTYLRNEFRIVADAGDYLVYGIAQSWEKLKQVTKIAWEAIKFAAVGAIDLILESFAGMLRGMAKLASVEIRGEKIFGGTADGLGALANEISGVLTPLSDYEAAIKAINTAHEEGSGENKKMLADMQNATAATFAAKDATEALADTLETQTTSPPPVMAGVSAAAKDAIEYLKDLEKRVATFGMEGTTLERFELDEKGLSPEQLERARELLDMLDAMDEVERATKEESDALALLGDMAADAGDSAETMKAKMAGLSDAQIKYNRTLRDLQRDYKAAGGAFNPAAVEAYTEAVAAANEELATSVTFEAFSDLYRFVEESPILTMTEQIETLREELEKVSDPMSEAFDPARAEQLVKVIDAASGKLRGDMLSGYKALLGAAQTFTKEGSSGFRAIEKGMAAISIVQEILATKAAVTAVLTQGQGEPYSAWARMAAMAAAVAPLLASIGASMAAFGGGGGGPSSASAEVRQERQGTGTVLGDAEAKSESILNATEITANATEQLVGLNRGMLNALLALQDGLVGAAGLLARGAGDVEFADVSSGRNILNPFGKDPLGGALGNLLFGGKKSIIDQGIIIAGGALQEMLENIVVGAYQTIKTDGGLFGSDKIKDDVVDISGEFGTQFQLVIGSIIDTVREGALALGLLPDDIEAAIAAFRVEEIRISLKDLSAEEQQAELEAVFSSIFDGLAGAVVPFIEQFQQVGEGLGETLVRIATEVQVAQEAFRQFGMVIDQSDPERFAQIADGLVQAVGGLDEFISGMQSFVANFAPEAHQFTVASDALSSAFEQVGLSVPATRDGMWELMQSLDATTEEGREQIATLLRLADTAAEYYDLLEQRTQNAIETLDEMGLGPNSGLSEFGRTLQGIEQSSRDAIDAANTLAIAEGRTGASTRQLAAIHRWTAQQIAAAIRQLQAETQDLIAQLYGGEFGTLDALDARISELEGATGSWSNSIGDVASASDDLFERWRSGIESVQDYLDSMLLGDLSALTPEEQLAEAQRQLLEMQAAAMGGDADALTNLPQLADAYLRMLREYEASGEDYNAGFDWVRDLLQSVVGLENPGTPNTDAGSSGGGGGQVVSPELQELYEQRDRLLAEQELAYRAQLAQDLTQHLADLAFALNVPILELIDAQGVNLQSLATDLGVNLQDLTASSVEALGFMASTLGISMTELTGALGLSLTDLAGGLTELTEQVGIDLGALTVESTQSLAALAASLGMDLSEFAAAVGTDLGSLADSQSLLNDALEAEINALPEAQRDQLAPLLEAVENATTEADANAAIAELENAVNALGGETANALAPYLDGVFPQQALDQLDYLGELRRIASDQLSELMSIYDALRDGNRAADVPGYAVGTGYVPKTGLAMIHEGEAIIPAPFAAWMRDNGMPVMHACTDDGRVAAEVRALREEVAALRRDNSAGHARTAQAVTDGDAKARQQRDEIARRNETIIRRTA